MKSDSAAALSLVFALAQSQSVSADNVSVYHLRRREKFVLSCLREDIDITSIRYCIGTHIISYVQTTDSYVVCHCHFISIGTETLKQRWREPSPSSVVYARKETRCS